MQKIAIFNPLIADEKSAKRGVGRYVSALIEALGDDARCISTVQQLSNETVLLNPFINFYQPPTITKRYAAKQIGVIHDVIPLQYPHEFSVGLRGKLHLWQNKRALKNYDTIITDSIASKNSIKKILGIESNVIYPATSGKLLSLPPKKPDTPLPEMFLLYVGDGTWNKNLVAMAHAIMEANIPLVLAGNVFTRPAGNHPWERELREFQQITKDNPLFVPLGFVTDSELVWLYQHAQYNVLLSRDEGFGYSFLEAAQFGTCSILSDIPVFREIAQDTAVSTSPEKPTIIPAIDASVGKKAQKRSKFFSLENFRNAILKLCIFFLFFMFFQNTPVHAEELLKSPNFENSAHWGAWNAVPEFKKNASMTSGTGRLMITYTFDGVDPAKTQACWIQDIADATKLTSLQGKTTILTAAVQRSDGQYSANPVASIQVRNTSDTIIKNNEVSFSSNENITKSFQFDIPNESLKKIRVQFCMWDSYEINNQTNKTETITKLSLELPEPTPTPTPTIAVAATPTQDLPLQVGYTNHIGIGQTEKDPSNSNTMALWVYIFMSVVYVVFIQLAMQMRTQFNRFLLYGAFILGGVIGYFMNNYLMGFFVAMLLSLLFW